MSWLAGIQSIPAGGSGFDAAVYTDPQTGWVYSRRYSVQGQTDASEAVYTFTGYVGAPGGEWYPGKRAELYDENGRFLSSFEIKDPNRRDWGGMVALLFIAAVTAGAAYTAVAGAAGTGANAGYGIVGGATEPAASIVYGGAEAAATGAATTAAATTAATTTAATTTATTLASAGSVASTVAGVVAKVAGAATAVLGLQNAAAGPSAPSNARPTFTPITTAPSSGGGLVDDILNIDTGTALVLAAALGLVAFVAKKG